MRRKIILLWILLFPALIQAQKEKDAAGEMKSLYADLEVGQQLNLGKTSVNFIKVISDSRCPKQVTCIWPGEARVLIGIKRNGKYFEKEVVVSGSGAEIPISRDVLLVFSFLRPYPETGTKIATEEYCLRFTASFPVTD